jgi:hypothetical protein
MADERFVRQQLLELKKAHDALNFAVTLAHRWPQAEFNKLLIAMARRVEKAAQAVTSACLPMD